MDIILDIDGTLADCTHRLPWIQSHPRDWTNFNALIHADTPFEPMRETCNSLYNNGNTIILCTGREEPLREGTEEWLAQHGISYSVLYMRAKSDFREDDVVKAELLDKMREDGYDPQLAFEDRSRIVVMWRQRGLLCCQVANGDF